MGPVLMLFFYLLINFLICTRGDVLFYDCTLFFFCDRVECVVCGTCNSRNMFSFSKNHVFVFFLKLLSFGLFSLLHG